MLPSPPLMGNLNKNAARNEVNCLKADFEQLCSEGKVTSESKVVMSSLFMIVKLYCLSS